MTVISSEIANTSSSRCETKTTAQSAASSREITSNSRSTSLGLSDAVGSSKMIRFALSASALAISTSWRCAAERSRASASRDRERSWPRSARISLGAPAHRRTRQAAGTPEVGQEYVFEHGKIGREARLLHHHRDARIERFARRTHVERSAAIKDLAAVATNVPRDHARERRLAGAVGAEQGVRRASARLRLAPASARVCAKFLAISRASSRVAPASAIVFPQGKRAGRRGRPAAVGFTAVRWRTRSL